MGLPLTRHRSALDRSLDAIAQANKARTKRQRDRARRTIAALPQELRPAVGRQHPPEGTEGNWSGARVERINRMLASAAEKLEAS